MKDDYPNEWDYGENKAPIRTKTLTRKEVRNAANTNRPESDEKHEEGIQVKEKGEESILCLDKQEKARKRKVASVRKKRRRKRSNADSVLNKILIKEAQNVKDSIESRNGGSDPASVQVQGEGQ